MSDTGVSGALTDGTGISRLTASKVVKDFVADLLLSGSAAIATVGILSVDQAVAQPAVITFALLGSTIRVIYRAVLKWAQTP